MDIKENYEIEKGFEDIIKKIKTLETDMPEDYRNTLEIHLHSLPRKKATVIKPMLKMVSGIALIILLLSGLIYSNESFASFAKGVPFLDKLAEFVTTDAGTENAMLHDYPVMDPVVIKDGPYTLTLSHMMIDEERMTFTTTLEGPNFTEGQAYEKKAQETIGQVTSDSPWHTSNGSPIYAYDISVDNDRVGVILNSYESYNQNKFSIEFNSDTGESIRSMIEKEAAFILECTVYKNDEGASETIYSFDPFKVAMNEEDILPNVVVDINQKIEWKEGHLILDKLVVSPSKMAIKVYSNPEEGILSIGLEEMEWMDASGGIYGIPTLSQYEEDEGEVTYQIVPSIYFDDVKELILRYKSYYYELDHEDYSLSINDVFPKTYEYYGHSFTITSVEKVKGELRIDYEIGDESDFDFSSIELIGYESNHIGMNSMDRDEDGIWEERYSNYYDVGEGEGEAFTFKLSSPRLIVHEKGMIHIPIH